MTRSSGSAGGVGLRAKLQLLLLGFGVIPLGVAIFFGYRTSRSAILAQVEAALHELTRQQGVHVTTELRRQRLLLRTIVGHLADAGAPRDTERLGRILRQSLPEDGVYDGLRLVSDDGRVLADVALRDVLPHWPGLAPAADWTAHAVSVHREGDEPVAYIIAVGAGANGRAPWLEGHVRAADFPRLFSLPTHMMEGAKVGIFDARGRPVLTQHIHAIGDMALEVRDRPVDSVTVGRGRLDSAPAVVALAPVPETRWVVVVSLPLRIALAPVARMRNVAVAGATALVALLVLTGVVAARSVTTPVRQLADAARAFGRSGTVPPLPDPGADEIGSLVRSFERMTQDLQRSQDEIRRLHEAELQRTQQLASVGELASGVAHEIRNPLTGVLGALDLALKRIPAGDRSRPLLEESEKQLRRIEETTSQLLRYARPPELREVTVDANELLERAATVLAPQAGSAGVGIHTRRTDAPVPVRADPEQVVQVLVNLGLNAIQAMDGEGIVTLAVSRSDDSARIEVDDTGPGVADDLRPEIFRPFFTTKHQGTGLGLPISRQIIERHGGRMWLAKRAPGATFVIELPLSPEEDA